MVQRSVNEKQFGTLRLIFPFAMEDKDPPSGTFNVQHLDDAQKALEAIEAWIRRKRQILENEDRINIVGGDTIRNTGPDRTQLDLHRKLRGLQAPNEFPDGTLNSWLI